MHEQPVSSRAVAHAPPVPLKDIGAGSFSSSSTLLEGCGVPWCAATRPCNHCFCRVLCGPLQTCEDDAPAPACGRAPQGCAEHVCHADNLQRGGHDGVDGDALSIQGGQGFKAYCIELLGSENDDEGLCLFLWGSGLWVDSAGWHDGDALSIQGGRCVGAGCWCGLGR